MDQSPKRSFVQIPDSSPSSAQDHSNLFKEKSVVSKNNLKERFSFNGSDLMKTKPDTLKRDLELLHRMFGTISENMIKVVYQTKAKSDLKTAKLMLTEIIEKRKRRLMMETMDKKQNHKTVFDLNSSQPRDATIEISSSPVPSPKKAYSSKVVLEKKQTISEKYSTNMRARHNAIQIPDDEPLIKKRRLVRGSRQESPTVISDSDGGDARIVQKKTAKKSTNIIDLDEEEDLNIDENDSGSDVEEETEDNDSSYFDAKILDFFNSAPDLEIVDVAGCDLDKANRLISKRPFRSLNHFESMNFDDTKRKRFKTDGEMFSSRANAVFRGYHAVDSLVQQCSKYSQQISDEINKWGVQVQGVNDELEIVDVNTNRADDDDDDDDKISIKTKMNYITEKPSLLADEISLKNYQQVGLNWMNLLYKHKLSCILADEMGLGKTCQVIAFLALLKQKGKTGTHLVVVPSSTLENWMREFNKFAPSLVVEPYYGSQAEREEMREVLREKMSAVDVIVTTYQIAAGSKEDHSFLKYAKFNVVVYDEGHMLKNSTSNRFQKLVKIGAQFRMLLTGTPLQNNLKELMSLLEFILPALFVSKKEEMKYVFSQKARTNDNKKTYNPLLSQRAITSAKRMMAPFILRRRKDQVLQHLPKKHSSLSICTMTDKQREIYQNQIAKAKEIKEKKLMTNVIMDLRKAAIHPLLFRHLYTDEILHKMSGDIMKEEQYRGASRQFIYEDMEVMSDFELNRLCGEFPSIHKYILPKEEFLKSGKVTKLKELLDKMLVINNGKILIFSLFTQVLDILEQVLSLWSIKFTRLDGQTPVEIRHDVIDKFYQDETIPVFLLSTKAGGFGINLVCANNVIIFDQSFNPHDDKQAEDRAHRVGQEKEVNVIRIITRDSIEENMYLLAQNKLELDQSMSGEQIENKGAAYISDIVFGEKKVKVDLIDNTVLSGGPVEVIDAEEIRTVSPSVNPETPELSKSETPSIKLEPTSLNTKESSSENLEISPEGINSEKLRVENSEPPTTDPVHGIKSQSPDVKSEDLISTRDDNEPIVID